MKPTSRIANAAATAILAVLLAGHVAAEEKKKDEGVAPEEALSRLVQGNERYVSGHPEPKDFAAERKELAGGQHPYAIVLACADSRVAPEIVFDESLGRLFVVRVAGNVADPVVLGSIEYAVEHLQAHLLVVLGHESCGAVKATLAGGEAPPNIAALVSRIAPAADRARSARVADSELLATAVRENVRYQMQMAVYQSDALSELVHKHELQIAGGVYDLDTGKVDFLPAGVAVEMASTAPAAPEKPAAEEAHEEPHAAAPAPVPTVPVADRAEASDDPTPLVMTAEARRRPGFAELVQRAFETESEVRTRVPLLMRDESNHCVAPECKSIPQGSKVRIANPNLLASGAKQRLLVSYRGKAYYVLAERESFDFPWE